MTGKILGPLLAPNTEKPIEEVLYPCFGSVKLDGFRMMIVDGECFSRSGKTVGPFVENLFQPLREISRRLGVVFDGEVWSPLSQFSDIMRACSSLEKAKTLQFHCFDMMSVEQWRAGTESPFVERVEQYHKTLTQFEELRGLVVPIEQTLFQNVEDALAFMARMEQENQEGMMVRSRMGRYKHGRATLNEGLIYKFKRWAMVDAQIVGFKQATKMTEEYAASERGKTELGYAKRTTSKATRELVEAIGSVVCRRRDGVEFGADWAKDAEPCVKSADWSWQNRVQLIGRWVECRYQEVGTIDKPRMARIKRFRPDLDAPVVLKG